jgi:hypothetical protein
MDESAVDKMLQQKLREFLPPMLMEGIAAWNATG